VLKPLFATICHYSPLFALFAIQVFQTPPRINTITPSDQFQQIQISAELKQWPLTTILYYSLFATICCSLFRFSRHPTPSTSPLSWLCACTCPQAITLAMKTTRKSIHGFPLLSNMGVGLCLVALRASSAPLLSKIMIIIRSICFSYNIVHASPGYLIPTGLPWTKTLKMQSCACIINK